MVASTLVTVAVVAQSPASASGYGADAFMNLDGSIRYVATSSPTNQYGWANSGAVTPASTCTPPGIGVSGSNGLFDCGSPSSLNTVTPKVKTFVPNPPNYVGPASFTSPQNVLAHGFQTAPSNNDYVNCASGATQGSFEFGANGFGNNKFDDGISQLTYQVGSVPGKDQLTDAYVVSRNASNHHIEVYFGEQRPENLGDAHIDFQFLQSPVSPQGDCGTHFNGQREQGDFLVEVNYTIGGTLGTPAFYVWTCTTASPTGTACDTAGSWVPTTVTTGPTGILQVVTNTAPTACGGWVCEGLTSGGLVDTNEFAEGAIDLTALASAQGQGFSLGCASNMFVETRSSQSDTATIEAFAKPLAFASCEPTTTVTTPSATSGPLGTSFTDGVTVTGNSALGAPTGDVTFYVCSNTTTGCNSTTGTKIPGTTLAPNPVSLTASTSSASTATSPSYTPTAPGNYCFAGYYTPTAGNFYQPSWDTSIGECFTVAALPPGFTTSPTTNPITFGGSNTDTATVSGNSTGGVPSGTVQFYLCKESTVGTPCTDTSSTAKVGSPVTLTAVPNTNNASALSPSATPSSAGTWCFNAVYNATPGGNYKSVTIETNPSGECFTVNQQSSNATTQVTATSVTFGSGGITDTVSVSPSSGTGTPPTGTVQFYVCETTATFCSLSSSSTYTVGNAVTLTVPTTGSTSTATSPTFMPTSAGTWCFAAVYSGDGNYLGQQDNTSSSNKDVNECVDVTQAGSATTTTVNDVALGSAWTTSETTGASAYDTASVAPSPTFTNAPVPTGTVSYTFFSNGSCNGTGTAAGTVTLDSAGHGPKSSNEGPLGAGSYSFQATYSGDTNYFGSTGACEPFTVGQGTSATVTTVKDATTTATWSGSETTGASAYDTTTVTPSSGIIATGTVSYTFFSNGGCTGNGTAAGTVTLTSSGAVPKSNTEGPLGAGSYSFQATYSGDTNYAGSTGACEPFTVGQGTSATVTTVNDVATSSTWSGSETTGASAYDTTTVTPSSGVIATGTVSYTFFSNGSCNGTGTAAGTVTLTSAGAVPKSNNEGPLGAGSYSFQATYSGDTNYAGSTGACEPFTVGQGTSATVTTVKDATTTATWSGSETTGASAYDTTTVTPSSGIIATGTVSYTFFSNGSCNGNGTAAGTVTLTSAGAVPKSDTEGPLGAGSYSFQAVYSGDTNYVGSTGVCEPFNVAAGPSATVTTVNDAANSATWSGSETTGATAYDTATVGPKTPFTGAPTPSGTVSYTFFSNGTCTGTGTAAGTVTLTQAGAVPNSDNEGPLGAGSYSFQAVYSGDTNYASSTGACEPFTVGQGTSATATTVFDAATNAAWTGAELGTPSAYDTATVTPSSKNIVATGTVTYRFFPNGICSGDGSAAGTVTLTSTGAVPNSSTEGPLAQGSYSFRATYSGDTNYAGSTGACEPFTLAYPVINVVKSEPTPGDGQTVTAGQTAPITYNLSVTNTGLAPAADLTVTDVIPTGSTYVPGSANLGGVFDSTTNTISWAVSNVPAAVDGSPGTAGPLSFQVTVNAADADGSTITNQAAFSDINTVDCTSGTVEGTCLTNQVSNPVVKPIINVVKSEPTPGNGQTVTAGQTAPITYNLSVTNAGSAAATNLVVTDVIPAGSTYVANSANLGGTYDSTTKTITWTLATVPGAVDGVLGTAGPLSFQVTVNSTDASGSTITNQAAFTNMNTVNCTAGTVKGTCLTNQVSNPVIVPTTATAPLVTTTTVKQVLAFTGADVRALVLFAAAMLGSGLLVLVLGRRRRRQNG